MITAAEYAQLAAAAYQNSGAPTGWTRLEITSPASGSGYQGFAFKNASSRRAHSLAVRRMNNKN
jgi:hypothetical protein